MTFKRLIWEELGASAELTCFIPEHGIAEYHAILHIEPRHELFEKQFIRLKKAEKMLCDDTTLAGSSPVFKRYFLSDSTNQQPLIKDEDRCTISYIQQPPLDGSKIALWIYFTKGTEIVYEADRLNSTVVKSNGYEHIWTMGMMDNRGSSYDQTEELLTNYENVLTKYNATIADNCIRTWFFVRDVDTQYNGLVVARKENFEKNGLRKDTHYISSTGIGGNPSDTKALIQMGTYSMTGFEPSQQRYLYALTHLNKTIEYGVTFERGTLMEYGDRGHIYISGTASIDNKGNVLYVGDIEKQTLRMWENVETLLKEGEMDFSDVMQIIVYLRDTADYDIVRDMFRKKFPNTPYVITLAPVCRPTWLIEMECIAVNKRNNNYRPF